MIFNQTIVHRNFHVILFAFGFLSVLLKCHRSIKGRIFCFTFHFGLSLQERSREKVTSISSALASRSAELVLRFFLSFQFNCFSIRLLPCQIHIALRKVTEA